MKITFFEVTAEWEKEYLTSKLPDHQLQFFEEPIQSYDIDTFKDAEVISVFIYSQVTREIIEQMDGLKFITTRSTGYDHIELVSSRERGIPVSNVPYYGENTVAEHTFALILAISRNVHKSYLRAQRNDFSIDGLKGFDLQGRTIGIIGTGRIGIHVARIARGFGMKVKAYDVHHNEFLSELLGFNYVDSMEELLSMSDIVTLHVPYNKATHHLINRDNIGLFKKGSILINTSRGKNIQTEAILKGLETGRLAGVGLDVLEGEEYIKEEKQLMYDQENPEAWKAIVLDHKILTNERVVFTPHIAFYSQEALERILATTSQSIVQFINGTPQHVVN